MVASVAIHMVVMALQLHVPINVQVIMMKYVVVLMQIAFIHQVKIFYEFMIEI
jgi:hypothetical protein